MLGVLNLGTIQRRLRLNFADLYKKGLSCDSITGDFRLEGPLVSTSNLEIRSPSALFDVKGQINLQKETLDHQMEVTLPLSSSLYAGCLAGPAACAGIFVVDRIWGDKLDRTATLEYAVTGTWANPKVTETEDIRMTQSEVVAIRVTSGDDVGLLDETPEFAKAADAGAALAVLPENFAQYGRDYRGLSAQYVWLREWLCEQAGRLAWRLSVAAFPPASSRTAVRCRRGCAPAVWPSMKKARYGPTMTSSTCSMPRSTTPGRYCESDVLSRYQTRVVSSGSAGRIGDML